MAINAPWLQWLRRSGVWLLLGSTLLFVLAVRLHLRQMPLERDEGEYAYAGQLILQGVPPYKDAYTMKLPGTYAAYALIMIVFGQDPAGIRLGLALVNAASIVLVFMIGRRLLDDLAGAVAALTFGLLSLSPLVLGLMGHATHFVVLAALAGAWVLLPGRTRKGDGDSEAGHKSRHDRRDPTAPAPPRPLRHSPRRLLASGVFFGLAFLMKQHGFFFGVFGGLYLCWLWSDARRTRRSWLRYRALRPENAPSSIGPEPALVDLAKSLGIFGAGFLAPVALTCLVLWPAGVLHEFYFWTVSYAANYASALGGVVGIEVLKTAVTMIIGPNPSFWVLPLLGALVMWWDQRLSPHRRFFLIALLLCSAASVGVGYYFRPHYFITLLPAVALLSGVAVSRAIYLVKHDATIELFLSVVIFILFAVAVGASLIGDGVIWYASPERALQLNYRSTLFSQTARVAEYVRAHSDKTARIAVLGSEPEIYFLSRRRSATGHIYTYPLMEKQPFALKMQQSMIDEIERARPEYVVYVEDDFSWRQRPDSALKIFDWWNGYWSTNLELVQTFPIERVTDTSPGAVQDPASANTNQTKRLLLLKRKQAAP